MVRNSGAGDHEVRPLRRLEKASLYDLQDLLALARDLWPDYTRNELEEILCQVLLSDRFRVILCRAGTESLGFIYMSIRSDYVEGSEGTPTGYIEGIYVKPAYRKTGIAYDLLLAGERWCKVNGCMQIGSDTHLDNQLSYDFHLRAGFHEAAKLIAFIKDL